MTDVNDKMSRYASQIDEFDGSKKTDYNIREIKIQKEVPNPIRLVDTPNGVERYYVSWIICDDDKKRPFILENDFEGKSILLKLLGDKENFYKGGILESVKDPVTNKGKYVWEDKDPELLLRVAYNNDPTGDAGSWKPREEYIFNAIQRNPDKDESGTLYFWCKENKQTKLLKMGVMAYKNLQDVRLNDGELSEYDINYLKKGTGYGTKHNILKAGANVPNVVIGPLTEDEKSYTRNDLQKEAKLTSSSDILKYLRNTISRIDTIKGTNWIMQLESLARQQEGQVEVQQPAPQVAVPPQAATPSRVASRVAAPVAKEICGYCKKEIPMNSVTCPACNNVLQEPCAKCGTLFSVFETICPSCKTEYKVS